MHFVLDSTIVSALCKPKRHAALVAWFTRLLEARHASITLVLPEIVDYEVRRGLLQNALEAERLSTAAIRRLNELGETCIYRALDTNDMRRAALLWAEVRRAGLATAHIHHLDGDAILAAQAQAVNGTVITENLRHLTRFGPARSWQEIDPQSPADSI